jgi:hypothetical protein
MSQKRIFGFHEMSGPPSKRLKTLDEVSTLYQYLLELRRELMVQFVCETGIFDTVEFQGGITVKLEENKFPSIPPRLFKVNQALHLVSSIMSIGKQSTGVLTNQFGWKLLFFPKYPFFEFVIPSSNGNEFQNFVLDDSDRFLCTSHEMLTKLLLSFHQIERTPEMMSISYGNLSNIIMNFIETYEAFHQVDNSSQMMETKEKEFELDSNHNPRQNYVREVLRGMLKRAQVRQYDMLKSYVRSAHLFHQVVFSEGIVITMDNVYIPCIPPELLDTVLELSWLRSVHTLISSKLNVPMKLYNSFGLNVNFQRNEYTFQLERPKEALIANTIRIPDNFCGPTWLRNRECFSKLLTDHVQFSIAPSSTLENPCWILYNDKRISEFVKTLFTFHGMEVTQERANLFSRVLELFCPFLT